MMLYDSVTITSHCGVVTKGDIVCYTRLYNVNHRNGRTNQEAHFITAKSLMKGESSNQGRNLQTSHNHNELSTVKSDQQEPQQLVSILAHQLRIKQSTMTNSYICLSNRQQ